MVSGGSMIKKNIWGPGPSSFGSQQRLNEITIEPIENLGGLGKIWGGTGHKIEPPLPMVHVTGAVFTIHLTPKPTEPLINTSTVGLIIYATPGKDRHMAQF